MHKLKYFLLVLSLMALAGCSFFNSPKDISKEKVADIELVNNHYYLFYPSDSRTTQNYTYVTELDNNGEIVQNYKITDDKLSRFQPFQNPLSPDVIYLKKFGEPTLEASFFEYELTSNRFTEKQFDYFNFDLGITNFFTYGENMILTTIVSHKTGEQNITDSGDFQVSISNVNTKETIELPYKSVPMTTVNLFYKNKAIYMTAGYLADEEKELFENKGIGIVNFSDSSIQFLNPEKGDNNQYWSIYSDEDYFYVFGDSGTLYQFSEDFSFKKMNSLKKYKDIQLTDEVNPMYLSNHDMLYTFYNDDKPIVGVLSLKDYTFKEIDLGEIDDIDFLYQNKNKSEIYLKSFKDEKGSLIVLDNKKFKIKKEIPIKYPLALDFVIHK